MSHSVDLHFHTQINSRCSNTSLQDLLNIYKKYKTPIVITDHRADVKWKPPIPHIFGREVHVPHPSARNRYGTTDIIIFGWQGSYPKVSDEENGCFKGSFEEFLEIYKRPYTALVAVHPTRTVTRYEQQLSSTFTDLFKAVDAVEVFNGCDREHHYIMNYRLATDLGVTMVAGSDDHHRGVLYRKELTLFQEPVTRVEDIVQQIKERKVTPHISSERTALLQSYNLLSRDVVAPI